MITTEFLDDSTFRFELEDGYESADQMEFSGHYYDKMKDWPAEVIDLDKGSFSKAVSWEASTSQETLSVRLFREEGKSEMPEMTDMVDCDTGFED